MLLIDCHEPGSLVEKLQLRIPVEILKLKYGDYSFSDCIIERKTLSDFFSPLKNQRLVEQIENLNRFYTENYLLIGGFFDFSYVNNLDYLYYGLFKITLDFDAKLIFSKDIGGTADAIRKLYFRKNFGYRIKALNHDKIHCASRLFDINHKKFEILLSKFGNLKTMANADINDFKHIKSIGKRTIEKIKNTLNENIVNCGN